MRKYKVRITSEDDVFDRWVDEHEHNRLNEDIDRLYNEGIKTNRNYTKCKVELVIKVYSGYFGKGCHITEEFGGETSFPRSMVVGGMYVFKKVGVYKDENGYSADVYDGTATNGNPYHITTGFPSTGKAFELGGLIAKHPENITKASGRIELEAGYFTGV